MGQKISSVEDLVDLSQVFRNPQFETLRYIYVDSKTGKILAHEGVTSRLPGTTSTIIGPRKKVASAIEVRADTFLTNDKKLKQVKEIKVMVLKDYL